MRWVLAFAGLLILVICQAAVMERPEDSLLDVRVHDPFPDALELHYRLLKVLSSADYRAVDVLRPLPSPHACHLVGRSGVFL